MVRFKIHRKEKDQWLAICSAILYIKDRGAWRLATKAEGDVFGIQIQEVAVDTIPFPITVRIPESHIGADGDYYALLYPLAPNGESWDGEVWGGTEE